MIGTTDKKTGREHVCRQLERMGKVTGKDRQIDYHVDRNKLTKRQEGEQVCRQLGRTGKVTQKDRHR